MFSFLKKNFALIFIILFVVIFSIFNKEEYIQNYENTSFNINEKINLEEKLSKFKLENLKEIENIEFYYTPYKNLLDKIVNKIKNSEKRVYVEVYMLTETRIQNALIKAKNKGVEVKVILEKNPYKATNINNKHFKYLKNAGIDIVRSNPDLYSLNHSKIMIIDDEVIISTGNLTYSTFTFNRDFFLFIDDKKILIDFLKIFIEDFYQKRNIVYDDNLVLSPDYSRSKFKIMFQQAKKSLDMYFQYIEDRQLENILLEKANSGVKIRIIVSENFYNSEKEKINFLERNNILIKPLLGVKMHSKAILVDNKYLFIGSINFSSYSLDKNREVGIVFPNKNIIGKFSRLFEKDFAK